MARKILFYTHAFSGGGAETVFARLADAMADAGHDVVFAADFAGSAAVHDRPRLRHTVLGPGHVASTRRLAEILKDAQLDASFSALGAQNLKHLAAAIIAKRRARCVLGYHGFAAAEPQWLSRASYWASPLTTRLARRTVCVSDALIDHVHRRWLGSRRRMVRIYNPVPRQAPAARLDGLEIEAPLVVACGRLVPVKRFEDLVVAFADVRPTNAVLAILGEGPERATIETAIVRLGLSHRVRLIGHVDDPSGWYRRAACVAIASATESFGLTAAEALAFGVPVVTTDCGGPPEILDHGRLGLIVPIGDTAALSAAISHLIACPDDPAPRIERARVFALDTVRDAYLALVDQVSAVPCDASRA